MTIFIKFKLSEAQQARLDALLQEFENENNVSKITIDGREYLVGANLSYPVWLPGNTKEDIRMILERFPMDETYEANINYGKVKSETNFAIYLDNPCVVDSSQYHHIRIQYTSNGVEIGIKVPVGLVGDLLKRGERDLSDTEYHYFPNDNTLKNKKVLAYRFGYYAEPMVFEYQGGYKTSLNKKINEPILQALLS